MVFVGYTADFLMWMLAEWQITFETWPARIVMLAVAVLLICIGDALYFGRYGDVPLQCGWIHCRGVDKRKIAIPNCKDCAGLYLRVCRFYFWDADGYPVEDYWDRNSDFGVRNRSAHPVL